MVLLIEVQNCYAAVLGWLTDLVEGCMPAREECWRSRASSESVAPQEMADQDNHMASRWVSTVPLVYKVVVHKVVVQECRLCRARHSPCKHSGIEYFFQLCLGKYFR